MIFLQIFGFSVGFYCAVVLLIGFITDFEFPIEKAIRWPVIILAKLFHLIVKLVTWRARRTAAIAARCDAQHDAFISGLMSEDDDLYNQGLYGDYQPTNPPVWKGWKIND